MSEPNLRSQETVEGQSIRQISGGEGSSRHHDKHVRIHLKKLYGRSSETAKLLQAYRRMTDQQQDNQRPEIVVIFGNDGVGKSTLAQTLDKHVTDDGGYFVRGKFDRISSGGQPYTGFIQAFQKWTSLILSRGMEASNAMRNDIEAAVPDYESRILIDMIPSLEQVIGLGEERARQGDSPKRMRFAFVFRKFVRAICSPQRPLVILLDDIDYADQSSLDLLSTLIPEASNEGIMFIASCKDAQSESPVSNLFGTLEKANVLVTKIKLLNLNDETVNSIVADILELPASQTKHLSDFIYQETMGNIHFLLAFLCTLQEKSLLRFDDENMRWVVSEKGIYEEMESCNVGQLIMERMATQHSQSLLEVLKVAACLGSTLDNLMLDRVFGTCVARHLFLGSECGFLVYDTQLEQYSFAHDTVQNAAYSLIPKDERPFFHLSIGRKLRRNLRADHFDKNIFVIMNQFRLGADCIRNAQEKYDVAVLSLETGEKAVSASSFPTASLYLDLGIQLLGASAWNDHYELSLALYNTAAEVNYCTADFERVSMLHSAVLHHGRSFRDKLRAYESDVCTLGATDRMEQAIESGLNVLKELHEPVPANPTARQVHREYRRLKRITDAKSNESLLRLPLMKDPDKLEAVKMMNLVFLYAHLCRPQLSGILTMRMMRLTLDSGLSAMTSSVFVLYGMLLCSSSAGDANEGYRFGCLGLSLLEKFAVVGLAWLPRVFAGQYACISPWKRPFRESQDPLKQSVTIGLEFGDIEYSMLNANLYCFTLLEEGRPLPFIQSEIQNFRDIMILQKQESALALIQPFSLFIDNLMGQKHDLVSASGQLRYDRMTILARTGQLNSMHSFAINFHGTVMAYLFGDYDIAYQLIFDCHNIFQHPLAGFDKCSVAYWTSLVCLALAATSVGKKRSTYLFQSRRYTKMLKSWVLDSPHNVLAGLSLIEAEVASITGKSKQAFAKYLVAISVAKGEALLKEECIVNERIGRHFLRLNDFTGATPFLQRSCELYLEWGSKTKANHLKNEFSQFIGG